MIFTLLANPTEKYGRTICNKPPGRELKYAFQLRKSPSVSIRQRKLDQPGRNRRLGNLTERGSCADIHRRWEPKYRMVPDIEYVHTGLKLVAFFEGKRLDQRKVPVLLERPAESISRNSAERLDSRACRVWNGWCRGKAGWI